MRHFVFVLAFAFMGLEAAKAEEIRLTESEERSIDRMLLKLERRAGGSSRLEGAMKAADDVTTADGGWSNDPSDDEDEWGDGGWGDGGFFPSGSNKNGAAETVAVEVLFQTLNFYGVSFFLDRVASTNKVEFKIRQSRSGYFTQLTKVDIVYSIKEFGRFLKAHLCNDASMENFYKAFLQVPEEEIGLRFKNYMAWALMGNSLPKQPNEILKFGGRWSIFQEARKKSKSFNTEDAKSNQDLTSLLNAFDDLAFWMTKLNQIYCIVDIRIDPRTELRNRIVVQKILDSEKRAVDRANAQREWFMEITKKGQQAAIQQLRSEP